MYPHQQTVTPPSEVDQPRVPSSQPRDASWKEYSDQWNENHGTFLMIFATCILAIGLAILTFQQIRFRKPAFPSYESIARSSDKASGGVFASTEVEEGVLIDGPTFRLRITGGEKTGGEETAGSGSIRIAAYSSIETFNQPEFAVWKRSIAIPPEGDAECVVPIDQLPSTFAIAAFQDVNENGELDRSMLGVPTERYGFTNGARGTMGPPSYDDAVVERPVADGVLELTIR